MLDIAAASLTNAVPTKQCSDCGEELPLSMFYNDARNRDGLKLNCKTCRIGKDIARQKANPVLTMTGKMITGARHRARRKHLNFNIDHEHVRSLVVSHCPILGVPLKWSCNETSGGFAVANSPSLDRIDPSKGYVKGNVWIISNRANTIKSNATHEELKLVTKAVGEAIVKSLEF